MSYFAPFWRLLTVSASSLGSPGYLQNRFCQAHWSIMHWHQRAYFHFNNTEIFLLLRDFFFSFFTDLCDRMKAVWRWSNSRLFQVTSPLSVCQSCSREGEGMRGIHDWRDFLQNNTKSLAFSCSSLCTRETCHNPALSVTVSHGSSWIQQWTGASCLVTCYLYHVLLFCVKSLATFLKKILGRAFHAMRNVPWHLFGVISASLRSREVK